MITQIRRARGTSTGSLARRPLLTSGLRDLPPELLDGCRSASLQLGGPALVSLGVISTVRGEGRSSVAAAMAVVQADTYQRRVALLDLDLEKPGLCSRLGASPAPGVSEVAGGKVSLEDVLQPLGSGITLIAGGAGGKPATRMMADVLRSGVLRAIAQHFDVIIADLPPLLGCSFGEASAAAFAELLLVVRCGVTPAGRIRRATAHLPQQPRVLLNGARSNLPSWVQRLTGV
jgi:Mrp family chromosome partitioning ATPase